MIASQRAALRWALAGLCLGGLVAPTVAAAQTPAPAAVPAQGQTVAVLAFGGTATQDRLADVEATVRGSLLARGARVPDRQSVNMGLGVSPPRDALGLARAGQSMGATHVLSGEVVPFAGQYNLTLTLYEVPSGRSATQARNVGDHVAGEAVAEMLDALFAPGALGPAPVDPDAARRAEEERRAAEERQREAAARDAEAQRRRAAEEAERRRRAEDAARPVRRYDAGGPISLGGSLHFGGLLSDTRTVPTMVISGTAPGEASTTVFALRFEAAYALNAVRGLELAGALSLLAAPTSAFSMGVGAQYTFPASGRLPLRGTAGVLVGVWQGITGARATALWLAPFVRAEYGFTPRVAAFAGLSLEAAPADGGVTTLAFAVGARVRFGTTSAPAASPAPTAP